jgi:hypothetical protein
MQKAKRVTRMIRSPRTLFLTCLIFVLAGCQHPLAPSAINRAALDARATARLRKAPPATDAPVQVVACVADSNQTDDPRSKGSPQIASAQKDDSIEGQLGDALLVVFKTFTGR